MIGGLIVLGQDPLRVIVRAIGPSLTVSGALGDPTLELHDGDGALIASNDNWRTDQEAEIIATTIPPPNDLESAIVRDLAPGNYTAIVRGVNNTPGVALVEAYQLGGSSTPLPSPTPTPTPSPTSTPTPTPTSTPAARFGSLTSRAMVETGDAIMVNAFIITGPEPKRVIVRGLGPSLALPTPLGDPVIELRVSNGTLIATNDDWRSDQEAEIIATGLPPANDLESAIVRDLTPGSYTVVLRGVNSTTGNGVSDLYDLSPSSPSVVTAAGTRANVLLNDEMLITSIAIQQSEAVLLRVLGPSLSEAGVTGVLQDPTVELRDGNGTFLISNDNWQDDPAQAAQILQTGLAPSNHLEAAVIANLSPGFYTALAAGKNDTIGIGYVQFYSLPHSGPVLNLTP